MPGYPLVWQMLYRAHLESGDRPAAEACIQQLRRLNAPGVADFDGLELPDDDGSEEAA